MPYYNKKCDLKDHHAFCDEISSFGNITNLRDIPNDQMLILLMQKYLRQITMCMLVSGNVMPVLRVSNDSGKSFGEKIMLAAK